MCHFHLAGGRRPFAGDLLRGCGAPHRGSRGSSTATALASVVSDSLLQMCVCVCAIKKMCVCVCEHDVADGKCSGRGIEGYQNRMGEVEGGLVKWREVSPDSSDV